MMGDELSSFGSTGLDDHPTPSGHLTDGDDEEIRCFRKRMEKERRKVIRGQRVIMKRDVEHLESASNNCADGIDERSILEWKEITKAFWTNKMQPQTENLDGQDEVEPHSDFAMPYETRMGSEEPPSSFNSKGDGEKRATGVRPSVADDVVVDHYPVPSESPIERKIRRLKEREQELMRDKGEETKVRIEGNRSTAVRIRREIEEHLRREEDLRATGSIATTSEEHVDSKVISHLRLSNDEDLPAPSFTRSSLRDNNGSVWTLGKGVGFQPLSSSFSLGQSRATKGVMAKFIASRGKMSPLQSFSLKGNELGLNSPLPDSNNGVVVSVESVHQRERFQAGMRRRFRVVTTVESRILEELKEMKDREAELRRVRAEAMNS